MIKTSAERSRAYRARLRAQQPARKPPTPAPIRMRQMRQRDHKQLQLILQTLNPKEPE
jgi:hypothetical protein